MAQNLLDHKMRKQFATIDRLITELVITRKYIYSAQKGLDRCRSHLTVGGEIEERATGSEQHFTKGQEELLHRLKLVEKRIKKQLRDSSRELGHICTRDSSRSAE